MPVLWYEHSKLPYFQKKVLQSIGRDKVSFLKLNRHSIVTFFFHLPSTATTSSFPWKTFLNWRMLQSQAENLIDY